ncbi:MAG: helix-turn-helix transcriptional regulator [bacterium]
MESRLMDTREAAEFLGVNEKQIYTLIHERGLPGTKVTGKWVFPRHLVERWIESSVVNMPGEEQFLARARGLLLIAGSDDPLLTYLISLYRNRFPDTIPLQSRAGSSEGLMALKKRICHIACLHLINPEGEGYNTDHLAEAMGEEVVAVSFAMRTQGILLSPGNPLGIESLQDLVRREARLINREVGTGTRLLLDRELDRAGLNPAQIPGYDSTATGHLEVGLEVMRDHADAGIAIEAVASLLGLDFIPIKRERFDLVVLRDEFFTEPVQNFLGLLHDAEFAREANALAGYDIGDTGKILLS